MRIAALHHVAFESPAHIRTWAKARGYELAETALHNGAAPPAIDAYDWLLVMGGSMSVHDEAQFPWLRAEKRAIREALSSGKLVVGICLGAQLVAEVLGARVAPMGHREIGWFPLDFRPGASALPLFEGMPACPEVFHWHGDTFDIPEGATHVAGSDACANQIFTRGDRVLGLQCHPEMTPGGAKALVDNCAGDLAAGPWVQEPAAMLADPSRFAAANAWLDELLERLEKSWLASTSA
jgi:GMP synthase-like glutamine amidotransferase